MNKLGLVAAMEVECKLIISKLNLTCIDEENKIYVDNVENPLLVLIISGIGMENSAISAETILLKYNVNHILNFGYAGSNLLKVGTLASPNLVFNYDFDLTSMGYKKYQIPGVEDLSLNIISDYLSCKWYSSNHFVTESNEEIPAVYDMELHGIAMACNKRNIPLSAIKIVTDTF